MLLNASTWTPPQLFFFNCYCLEQKKITPALHLSTTDMGSYITEEKLKLKEEVLKLQAERYYFISKKKLVDLEKRNASIKEKILLLKETLLKKKRRRMFHF